MPDQDVPTICPENRQQWREWLRENHDKEKSVWLIFYKKKLGFRALSWSDAVDEALCFGWIDSLAKPLDDERYKQFFSRRKPNSVWSKINKDKIEQLSADGKMYEAGLQSVEIAKQNGSWVILDDVEALIIPEDLEKAFKKKPNAKVFFEKLSRSDKRILLQWLVLAKRPETRQKRLDEIVKYADQNLKPAIIQGTTKPK